MKKIKADFPFYNVVREGGVSNSSFNEGRMFPIVIVDFEKNKTIKEMFEYHNYISYGNAEFQWGFPNRIIGEHKEVYLIFSFKKPMEINFGIIFKLKDFSVPIDGIIQSRGLIVQTGKKGDRVILEPNNKNIIVEIPDLGFDKKWDDVYLKSVIRKFRKENNLSKKEAKKYAIKKIKKIREIWNIK